MMRHALSALLSGVAFLALVGPAQAQSARPDADGKSGALANRLKPEKKTRVTRRTPT